MIKKYRLYKKLLIILAGVNSFLILVGAVACVRYFKENRWVDAELMWVGLGVLVFGVLLPLYVFKKLEAAVKEWETRVQKTVSQWVATIVSIQSEGNENEEFYKDPLFWLNMTLATLESLKKEIQNPFFQFVSELSPYIRQSLEIQKKSKKKTKSNKTND